MEEKPKQYICHICKSKKASGIWLLRKKKGGHDIRALCTVCWFTKIPERDSLEEVVFLVSLLKPETHTESEDCEHGLTPTGAATVLKTVEDIPKLIGVFVEMRCSRCGFLIDLRPEDVNAAKVSFLHPNRLYAAEH